MRDERILPEHWLLGIVIGLGIASGIASALAMLLLGGFRP